VTLRGVAGPTLTWLAPRANQCVTGKTATLDVVAGSSKRVTSVRFLADGHQVAVSRRGTAGLFSASWRIGKTRMGRHVMVAVATDAAGKRLSAVRAVRVCR
jgi:Bacterial Ig domain